MCTTIDVLNTFKSEVWCSGVSRVPEMQAPYLQEQVCGITEQSKQQRVLWG